MNPQNPLAKLEIIISVIGCLTVLGLVVLLSTNLTDRGSVFSDAPVCADVPHSNLLDSSAPGDGVTRAHVAGLADEVRAYPTQFELCANDPTIGQRLLSTLKELPGELFFLGFLFLTWRGTRQARRRGPFTPEVAASISALGTFLFFGQI